MHKLQFLLAVLLLSTTIAHAQSPATGQILGHDYVDLGLSVMWATCNIGANSPSDYGDYFAWGEAETKAEYTWKNSATQENANYTFLDAAKENWGKKWRMPTAAECQELCDKCTWVYTVVGNSNGCIVTGPNGNSIFLPRAGYRVGSSVEDDGQTGSYWSCSHSDDDDRNIFAQDLTFALASIEATFVTADYIGLGKSVYRYVGKPIRPVTK